jgi:hypothetical protein
MKAAITAFLCLAGVFYFSGPVSFFCFVALFGVGLVGAMDFYAVEKKNDQLPDVRNVFNEAQKELAPHPADTNPATVSNGSATEAIQIGERYHRNDEQAKANNYTDPDAPADTVQVANVAAPAKQIPTFELEIE